MFQKLLRTHGWMWLYLLFIQHLLIAFVTYYPIKIQSLNLWNTPLSGPLHLLFSLKLLHPQYACSIYHQDSLFITMSDMNFICLCYYLLCVTNSTLRGQGILCILFIATSQYQHIISNNKIFVAWVNGSRWEWKNEWMSEWRPCIIFYNPCNFHLQMNL